MLSEGAGVPFISQWEILLVSPGLRSSFQATSSPLACRITALPHRKSIHNVGDVKLEAPEFRGVGTIFPFPRSEPRDTRQRHE